jgi:hypothetical protein
MLDLDDLKSFKTQERKWKKNFNRKIWIENEGGGRKWKRVTWFISVVGRSNL